VASRAKHRLARKREAPPDPKLGKVLLPVVAQSKQLLTDGVQQTGPHTKKFRQYQRLVDRGFEDIQKFCSGRITEGELLKTLENFPKQFRTPPPPPSWLPPEFASGLLELLHRVETQNAGASQEFQDWLKKTFVPPRGRRPNLRLSSIGKEAAKLRAKKLTWGQITQKLCRYRGGDHVCTKACVDRVRQAAKSFE
jgi:hypothetical protein